MPTIYFEDIVVSEGEAFVDIVLRLDTAATQGFSVTVGTSNGTATSFSNSDYVALSTVVNFGIGDEFQTVRVNLGGGGVQETLESFYLQLSNATNGARIANTSALISIADNDTIVATPGLSVRDVVVDEKAGTATFAVVLGWPHGQASGGAVSVEYTTTDGTATALSGDYVGVSGTLDFAAGETVKRVTVDIDNDASAEGIEHFGLDLSNAGGATILKGHGDAVIGANDATAVALPRLSVSDAVVSESDGWVDFVVTLSAPGQNVVTVAYATTNGTATSFSASDYLARSGTLTFALGETTKTVRVQLGDDGVSENLETFYLGLNTPTNATIAKAWGVVNIVDDDTVVDTPTLFVRDAVVDEKAGTASFVVLLGGPEGRASNSVVTVNYASSGDTATQDSDYTGVTGTLTFAPGETVKTIVVDLKDDAIAEGFERFGIDLNSAVGATIVDGHAVAEIGASDATAVAQPRISVSDAVVSESDGWVDFVVTLSAPGQNVVTVAYGTADGTATRFSESDYLATSATLTFAPGETTKTVRVQLGDDGVSENLETFYLGLNTPTNATIAKAWGVVNIVDDDTVVETPTLFVRDAVVDEKAGTASFVVLLGGPTGQTSNSPVTVDFATANGSAGAGDFTARSGTLTFAPGESVKTITVDIADDRAAEALERIDLRLSNANGATIVDGRAVAEIGASDATAVALPHLSIANATVSEGDGFVDVVVKLSAPGQGVVSVNAATANGTATSFSASDYLATSVELTFAPGETTKTVRIQLGDDAVVENLETFSVVLSGVVGGVIDKATATITIQDQDTIDYDVYSYGRSDDVYSVDQTTDLTIENPGGGDDKVFSSATYTLGANVERLVLTGSANLRGTGNGLANTITGNSGANQLFGLAGNDTLNGGAGNDTMNGGLGNDLFVVGQSGDRVVESVGAGTDTVQSSISYSLVDTDGAGSNGGNVDNLTLTGTGAINGTGNTLKNSILGNSGANTLSGLGGNDTLDGAGGKDTLIGGLGNDVYVVGTGDTVTERGGQGTDTVQTTVTTTLWAEVEYLTLTGTAAINGTGNASNNLITGNSAANILSGLGGNDTLNGGAGADRMTGGTGNDTYYVDNTGDVVIELASAGIDTLVINRTASLSGSFANIENLTLSGTAAINGTGNASNNLITGNGAANRLGGGAGNDTLNGGVGADSLVGGAGNDTYVIDNAGDLVTESAGFGIDTVQTNRTTTLSGSLANVENLVLTGGAGLGGNGNAAKNAITGNSGANKLSGLAGNDTLTGGAGSDTVIGGAGNDVFVLDSKVGADRITDFSTPSDTVRISMAGIHVGDGDAQVENAVTRSAPGGFSKAAELVIFTTNAGGAITKASAAAQIGSATSAYATGDDRIFVVDYGTQSGVFLFDSSGANATVSANELTLLAVLTTASTAIPDYVFGP